jgi:two-component system sensor histidine kinase KdpD
LASIHAALSELEEPDLHDETTRARLVRAARVEAERLERLVSNLLSLARIEAEALQTDPQPVDLRELLTESSERLLYRQQDAKVSIDVPDDIPLVQLDPALFEQVMINLIENAARHSPRGGVVSVTATHRRGELTVDVCDDGPGVDPDELPRIFDAFRAGDRPGVGGVGLAICKAVVEAHHGTITAGNRVGGGARFRVVLPGG